MLKLKLKFEQYPLSNQHQFLWILPSGNAFESVSSTCIASEWDEVMRNNPIITDYHISIAFWLIIGCSNSQTIDYQRINEIFSQSTMHTQMCHSLCTHMCV